MYTLLNVLRRRSFWLKDRLLNNGIASHLHHIQTTQQYPPNNTALTALLQQACSNTAFYAPYINKPLSAFPVITKNTVRNQLYDFKACNFVNKTLKTVKTSGSTGTPLQITHNRQKVQRNTADTLYYARKIQYMVGDRLYYMRHWLDHYKKPAWAYKLQNIVPIEVLDLNDAHIAQRLTQLKNDPSPKIWQGYASAFDMVVRYLDRTKATPIQIPRLKGIITMSESLNPYTKQQLHYYFNVPVVARYSNTEQGIIAQQAPNSNNYNINWSSYYVELLDVDTDTPAAPHTLGRIVITDLYNYATPLIRYDTGDIGTIDYSVNPPVFTHIEGRKTDAIYNTKGALVSAFIIMNTFNYEGILQSQLIQDGKTQYTLKLNVTKAFNQEAAIINCFKGFLGNDAHIHVSYVNEIPVLASGKRKATVNNYMKA